MFIFVLVHFSEFFQDVTREKFAKCGEKLSKGKAFLPAVFLDILHVFTYLVVMSVITLHAVVQHLISSFSKASSFEHTTSLWDHCT